ncbi:hypothetical protein [Actinoplanes regularis]|uniref:Streptomycin adenylyltransferase n=1 Tax=Actinoplanes regularis TaxID=52697 RepID=A0A239ENW8_9ACTN|nr:hypothetical protein [Actinoplanes regularis]GIE89861.1 hypothetical protein Are01nite_63410 [Actinoplanes regularis]SNS46249.1 hypothetical protein SAMN06264365_11631 [Actinoplanes regularis]
MHPMLQRLDDLAAHLATRDDTIAVLGLGSAGAQRGRLDDHSDLDFFVVVEEGAVSRYTTRTDWLTVPCPVVWSFAHERHGRKALYADGVFVEYAVFTVPELRRVPFRGARVVWRRADAPPGLTESDAPVPRPPFDTVEFHLNEALANLYVGLHRELRGEHLSAARFIQGHAVDRVVALLRLGEGEPPYRDVFDASRRVERTYSPRVLPLERMVPGYRGNAAAARVVLDWLSARYPIPAPIGAAIEDLLSS